MHIDVVLNPAEIALLPNRDLSLWTCVIFDVLRATSSMVTGLAHGAVEIYPVCSIEDAHALKARLPDALLGGERKGDKIPGFDLGNSPSEYTNVQDRRIITTTTNGTVALRACERARRVLVGALVNLAALVEELRREGSPNVLLVCAGTFDLFALEDAYAAGRLIAEFPDASLGDAARAVAALAAQYPDPLDALMLARNGQALVAAARTPDIEWCAQVSRYNVVGLMEAARSAAGEDQMIAALLPPKLQELRMKVRDFRPPKLTARQVVLIAIIVSLFVHLAAFTALVIYSDASKTKFAKDRLKQREIELQVQPPDEPPPPPFTLAPPLPEHLFIDSRGLQISPDPAEHPLFEADENMKAASEDPATGDLPLPSQQGKDLAFNAFKTERSLLGPTARPFTPTEAMPPMPTTPPPPQDVAMEPSTDTPETTEEKKTTPPKPDDKKPTPDQKPSKPTDLKPVDKVAEDEIALAKKETHPKAVTAIEPPPDTPSPVAHAARLRPLEAPTMAKLTTPMPKTQPQPQPQPRRDTGYQPEQEQNRIEGAISNRGKKSVDALGTPMGRYRKQVSDAIGSRWYYYIHDRMDLLAFGSVRINFLIDAKGHISSVRVDTNTSNQSLADVSINAIRDAEIGPPPLDPASPMSQEPLEWSLTFTYYPFAK